MKTPLTSLIVTLLAAAPLACTATDGAGSDLPLEPGTGQSLGKADMVSLTTTPLIANISTDRLEEGGAAIITSAASWEDYFGTDAPADVDFDSQWVAFYGSGLKNTGGYSAEILGVHLLRDNGGLVLETKATSPGFDCIVTQAFTWPHTVVAFDIPVPAPTWAVHEDSDETRMCSPTPLELQQQLADSRALWDQKVAAAAGNYTYSQVLSSWVGLFAETTFVVESNQVIERHYESTFRDAPQDSWSEVGAELGSHDQGAAIALVDDLYDECANDILTRDPQQNEFILSFDDAGLLQTCQAWPNGCADDCGRGPRIGFINVD